jgi:DNA polymerase III epsilon subunit-like protein
MQTHGRDPAEVFREFARFTEGAVLVGHNVTFDLSMVRAHAARLGIALSTDRWDDTLDLSRRFLDLERHDLATVCQHFATDDASIPTVHPSKGFEFVTVIIAQLCVSLCALRNSAFRFIPSSIPHRPGSVSLCDLRVFAVQILLMTGPHEYTKKQIPRLTRSPFSEFSSS